MKHSCSYKITLLTCLFSRWPSYQPTTPRWPATGTSRHTRSSRSSTSWSWPPAAPSSCRMSHSLPARLSFRILSCLFYCESVFNLFSLVWCVNLLSAYFTWDWLFNFTVVIHICIPSQLCLYIRQHYYYSPPCYFSCDSFFPSWFWLRPNSNHMAVKDKWTDEMGSNIKLNRVITRQIDLILSTSLAHFTVSFDPSIETNTLKVAVISRKRWSFLPFCLVIVTSCWPCDVECGVDSSGPFDSSIDYICYSVEKTILNNTYYRD